MPEVDANTSILIAMSHQAMQNIKNPKPEVAIPNSVATILFMGFFIESNLNYLLKEIEGKETKNVAVIKKLKIFHGLTSRPAAVCNLSVDELDKVYPGIKRISYFRNSIAHGTVLNFTEYLKDTEDLRRQAKNIADVLFDRAKKIGYDIQRDKRYEAAIKEYANKIGWPL